MNNTVKATLTYFRFDISDLEQAVQYQQIKDETKGIRLWLNDYTINQNNTKAHEFDRMIAQLAGASYNKTQGAHTKEIEIETEHLYADQWNTAPVEGITAIGLRIHRNVENKWPNRLIKSGYFVTPSAAMKRLLENTAKCGYCGKQQKKKEGREFCLECLANVHLDEASLPLLRLRSIWPERKEKRAELSEQEKAFLLPLYREAQLKGKEALRAALKAKLMQEAEAKRKILISNAENEYKGFIWLAENFPQLAENCIYYNHTKIHSFGWRRAYTEQEVALLKETLSDFPCDYEIKITGVEKTVKVSKS